MDVTAINAKISKINLRCRLPYKKSQKIQKIYAACDNN